MQEIYTKYIQAKPANKIQAAQLTSSNSVVGNFFNLEYDKEIKQIIIFNKYKYPVAQLSAEDSKKIYLQINKENIIKCMLAYVTYCQPKNCHYATFLFIAYPKQYKKAYNNFTNLIKSKIEQGIYPQINIEKYEHNQIIKKNGNFRIQKNIKPDLKSGTVIVKDKISFTEKLIEEARNKNKGCYFASIVFLLTLAAFII